MRRQKNHQSYKETSEQGPLETAKKYLKKNDKALKSDEKIYSKQEIKSYGNIDEYIASPPVIGPEGKIITHGKVEYGLPSFLKTPFRKDKK